MATKAQEAVEAVITADMVRDAADACKRASDVGKKKDAAESEKKLALMLVFEPLLGITTSDELSALSPAELKRRAVKRIREGKVQLTGVSSEALLDAIRKTQGRRDVRWKEEFIAVLGEAQAEVVINAASERFSYTIDEPACL